MYTVGPEHGICGGEVRLDGDQLVKVFVDHAEKFVFYHVGNRAPLEDFNQVI